MTKHSFGGPWTEIKLDVLKQYLEFFNTALQYSPSEKNPFRRVYIDTFAGTGRCDIQVGAGNILQIEGSAKIAIETNPEFDEIHLADLKHKHVQALENLAVQDGKKRVFVHEKDANIALLEILNKINWRATRGVLFLDPYGMAVRWSSLERIAATQAIDVWYLFPISAVCRQAANNFSKIDERKAASLDAVLGTEAWRAQFYKESGQGNLFDGHDSVLERQVAHQQITAWFQSRLMTIFKGWVNDPILLPDIGSPQFALFFAVSNPSPKAVSLSKKAAVHLLNMFKAQKFSKPQQLNNFRENSQKQHDMFKVEKD
ncbi:three-Cys-motif partner protein TcmP [Massilia sp. W12]|uniref:three-Cys-motif partner protein TcmP n=1 Tax=Massilia sp. W12 TaxID=3126507 RepID=UPI0030CC421E